MDSSSSSNSSKTISDNTTIQISIVALLLSVIFGASWWASAMEQRVTKVSEENRDMVIELKEMNKTLVEIKVVISGKHKSFQDSGN